MEVSYKKLWKLLIDKDMKKKKDTSLHSLRVKLQILGVKLLPHKLVMRIWMRQQKHS